MEEWKEYRLKEICLKITDGSHSSPESVPLGYPMFSVKDMLENRFDYTRCKHISKDDFLKLKKGDCVPQKGDVLVAKDGSFLKQIFVCKETKEECILSSIAIFRPNRDIIYPDFLSYLLKSPKVYNYIANNCVSGSALPRIILKDFKEINITIPSINIQKKILNFLLPIDDKIELNRRINKNLEQQAQALFKSWFVDFEPFKDGKFVDSELGMIPKGWKVGFYTELVDIKGGGTPKTEIKEYWNGNIPFFSPKDISSSCFILDTEKYITANGLENCNSNLFPPYTVFITARGTVGKVVMSGCEMAMNQTNYALLGKHNISQYYVYLITLQLATRLLKKANGAVFNAITTRDFTSEQIIIPFDSVIKDFSSIIRPIYENILLNEFQIKTLSQLRDTILSRLMSGELKIKNNY